MVSALKKQNKQERSGQKSDDMPLITQRIYNLLEQDDTFNGREAVENEVARLDEASYGSYRTKDTILEIYDAMSHLPSMVVPAPKDAESTHDVPDVSQWETWLSPGPASPDVAHEAKVTNHEQSN